jgi:glycerophosphoryl diester phosphodiesterase
MKKYFSFLALLLFISCGHTKNMQEPLHTEKLMAFFDKEGHRGCRGLMPENTIPAMLHALDLGVTTLEMDAVITKDNKVILSHEPFFNHEITTKRDGSFIDEKDERSFNIYAMTYAETQDYDVGMKPNPRFPKQQKIQVHKPLLSDLLDTVQQYMTNSKRPFPYFNIETKTQPATDNIFHPSPAAFVDLLMGIINEKNAGDHVIIQSFDFRTLTYLHEHYPTVKTAMLVEGYDKRSLDQQLKDLGFIPTIYSPAYQLVSDELIKKCHGYNLKIIPWTVNDKLKIEELKRRGVDGIISDFPDLL